MGEEAKETHQTSARNPTMESAPKDSDAAANGVESCAGESRPADRQSDDVDKVGSEVGTKREAELSSHDTQPVRKRKSRWGRPEDKTDHADVATALPPGMTQSQVNSYVLHVRLDEIKRKLKDANISNEARTKLSEERAVLIEEALKSNPEMRSQQPDYRRAGERDRGGSNRYSEKVWIPQREYPDINFIGLLIGPRGNTLRKMEAETGARISIRGKGSLKDGKALDASAMASADEELHALISADHPDKVARAVQIVNSVIETSASTPEESNTLKQIQLRELARLNGTLREEDDIVCANCGQPGHPRYECRQGRSVTNRIICRICGAAGHTAADCAYRDDPDMLRKAQQRLQQHDQEYASLMEQLGEKSAATATTGGTQQSPAMQNYVQPQAPWPQAADPNAPWAQQNYQQVPPPLPQAVGNTPALAPWATSYQPPLPSSTESQPQ